MTTGYKYVVVTPARNEQDYIERTIQSVVDQTVRPQSYVVVSDGSTDRTDEIIADYAQRYDFITFVRAGSEPGSAKNFGSKVRAFDAGYAKLAGVDYDFIGNLDADVSFESDYFEKLLERFENAPDLGLSGGDIREMINGRPVGRNVSKESVCGACQLFRRACFEEIGGYRELSRGGVDAAAEIMTRWKGWRVRLQDDLPVLAHRRVLTGKKGPLATRFNKGFVNRQLGYHPLFQLAVTAKQMTTRPFVLGGLFMLAGYLSAMFKNEKRALPEEVVEYLQAEQLSRLNLRRRPTPTRSPAEAAV